ncbi:hypothetical protein Cenrod_0541 [Candidatus Symbiobacter mobilis CR]|uniref:Uncharacterized protein n=2 Tax=Candidatus Symbiobacter TaxID=1436289 RepID=U5N8Y6_9BURK|nr:hypothetical protein Cenrod_0541 [Candidatus Symbiobacter mobilis CR]
MPLHDRHNGTTVDALHHDPHSGLVDRERLYAALEQEWDLPWQPWHDLRPHLFAANAVFVPPRAVAAMAEAVAAIERIAALPGYAQHVLQAADPLALQDWGLRGACMGYDFHVVGDEAFLIEINTNAGGWLPNAALACVAANADWAAQPCTASSTCHQEHGAAVMQMFEAEWRLQRGDAPLRTVCIVDVAPGEQFLAPEFEMFRALFARHGVEAHIADPQALQWCGDHLAYEGQPVDMVYNRLTDFALRDATSQALRAAAECGAVVLTPHPRAHALLANKRNLAVLGQPEQLAAWGADAADIATLGRVVPATLPLTADNAAALWARRRELFFKPVSGYGSKAAYRGDKLTRGVWEQLQQRRPHDIVAQTFIAPPTRYVDVGGQPTWLKYDIRAYTYAGVVHLFVARLYTGQTTNFRTPGGGFAPVCVV